MTDSEIEDLINLDIYKQVIIDTYWVNIDCAEFKRQIKWSNKVKQIFENNGKIWNDALEEEIKTIVAESVKLNPSNAITVHNQELITILISSIENMIWRT